MLSPEQRARAARFRPGAVRALVRNPMVRPRWIGGTEQFWYPHETDQGIAFTTVDAETGTRSPAFDHDALARALAAARGGSVDAAALPLEHLQIDEHGALKFAAFGARWSYAPDVGCTRLPDGGERPGDTVSPDGRWAAFRDGDDLAVRKLATGAVRRLTTDGAPHYAYGKSPDMNLTTVTLARRGIVLPAAVLWSPDSRRLFTCRLDERAVPVLPLVQHVPPGGATRPVLHALRVAHSGDADIPLAEPLMIDIETGAVVTVALAPEIVFVATTVERGEAWWSDDSSRVWHLSRDRAQRRLTLWETNAATGVARELIVETEATFVDVNVSVTGLANIRVLEASGEVLWFSQSTGRAHLYLHDLATGHLQNRVTTGAFIVRDLVHVDMATRTVLFLAGGVDPDADPALRTLCRVGLDGTDFAVLTPEPGEHEVAMPRPRPPRDHVRPAAETGWFLSPSGRHFVDTHSALDRAPVSVLRRIDGSIVAMVAEATLAAELARAWRWPMPFRAQAADGNTELFGAIWLPTDFDPLQRYPVLDNIYPGPQRGNLPAVMLADTLADLSRSCLPQAFAELGFAVVVVDGRGLPLRDKTFHDFSYGRLDDPGTLADHVVVLAELGRRHAWIDNSRVGIFGHSGGGYASVRAMLEHPDVFHAAVATSGNHDQKGYSFAWCEKYQGPLVPDGERTNYDIAGNPPLADQLRGKLLLAYGDMDDNVAPALTLQLVDALIRADKDFELLVLPNEDHTSVWSNPWFLRRAMAFFVDALHVERGPAD